MRNSSLFNQIPETIIRQAGSVCYRCDQQGHISVLLVKSLRTGEWGLPKGHLYADEETSSAALREAFEEGGVEGTVSPEPFGVLEYEKHGNPNRYQVVVHLVEVGRVTEVYPQAGKRARKWFSADAAALEAGRQSLRELLERLKEVAVS